MAMKQRTRSTYANPFNKIERDRKEREELSLLNARRAQRQAKLNKINQEIDELTAKKEEHQKVIGNLKAEQNRVNQNKSKDLIEFDQAKADLKKKNRNFLIRFGIGMGVGVAAGIATILVSPLVFAAPIAATIACGAVAGAGLLHGIGEAIINFLPWTKRAKLRRQLKRVQNKEHDVERLKLEDKEKEEVAEIKKLQDRRAVLENEKVVLAREEKQDTLQFEILKTKNHKPTLSSVKAKEEENKVNKFMSEIEAIKQEARAVSKEQEKAKKVQEKVVPAENVNVVEENSTQYAYRVVEENLNKEKKFAGIMFGDNGNEIELA